MLQYPSDQGFIIYYNSTPSAAAVPTNTLLPKARSAQLISNERDKYWLFFDERQTVLAIVPEREVLVILKVETVGPADANLSK